MRSKNINKNQSEVKKKPLNLKFKKKFLTNTSKNNNFPKRNLSLYKNRKDISVKRDISQSKFRKMNTINASKARGKSQNYSLSKKKHEKRLSNLNFSKLNNLNGGLEKKFFLNHSYRKIKKIGEGANSQVFLVQDIKKGEYYALKQMDLNYLSNPQKFINLQVKMTRKK